MTIEFVEFPKIPRLLREIVITEKIDGTNAAVVISDDGTEIGAQSRNRLITPENDNMGFARWVKDNKEILLRLGPGHHFGEWWGRGIQRTYGLDTRRFSLFNARRWAPLAEWDEAKKVGLGVVPVIYEGPWQGNGSWSTNPDPVYVPDDAIHMLKWKGSFAAPGFMNPEGIVVFHKSSNQLFKIAIEKDDERKGQSVAA